MKVEIAGTMQVIEVGDLVRISGSCSLRLVTSVGLQIVLISLDGYEKDTFTSIDTLRIDKSYELVAKNKELLLSIWK